MKDFLLTYSYLIIAIITFVAPLLLFLLSFSHEGTALLRKNEKTFERETSRIFVAKQGGENFRALIDENHKKLEENKRQIQQKLNLLNPKRQVLWIFIPLTISLIAVLFEILVFENFHGWYNHMLSCGLLGISFIALLLSILQLLRVVWAMIDTKKMLEEDRAAVVVPGNATNTAAQEGSQTRTG